MKILKLMMMVCVFGIFFQASSYAQESSTRKQTVLEQEKASGILSLPKVSPEVVSPLYTHLYAVCAQHGGVDLANAIGQSLQEKVSGIIDRFLDRMERERLSVSDQYQLLTTIWNLIKRVHLKINAVSDLKKFCEQKALVYLIQIQIAGFLEQAEQILNIKTVSAPQYEQILQKITNIVNSYPQTTQAVQALPFQNVSGAIDSGIVQAQLGVQLGQLYKSLFNVALNDLKQEGFLSQQDIDALFKVTTFVFRRDCQTFHGNVQIKKISDSNGNLISVSLERLVLYVNVCYQEYVVDQMEQIVKDLMYHELAHYLYYFKDSDPTVFENICRQNDKRKLMCGESAFASTYAMSMDEEDYAETFADRYQGRTNAVDPLLQEKYQYFDMRFGKE